MSDDREEAKAFLDRVCTFLGLPLPGPNPPSSDEFKDGFDKLTRELGSLEGAKIALYEDMLDHYIETRLFLESQSQVQRYLRVGDDFATSVKPSNLIVHWRQLAEESAKALAELAIKGTDTPNVLAAAAKLVIRSFFSLQIRYSSSHARVLAAMVRVAHAGKIEEADLHKAVEGMSPNDLKEITADFVRARILDERLVGGWVFRERYEYEESRGTESSEHDAG